LINATGWVNRGRGVCRGFRLATSAVGILLLFAKSLGAVSLNFNYECPGPPTTAENMH